MAKPWTSWFDPATLTRSLSYADGAVRGLRSSTQALTAEVDGSETYYVTLALDEPQVGVLELARREQDVGRRRRGRRLAAARAGKHVFTEKPMALDLAPILIGRGADAAIRLDDDYVSTRHARVAASGDEWFVEDLGSTNGTYVGPVHITQPTTIGLGVQVRVGKTILELRK